MHDFDVYIAKDGQTYRYLINNAAFRSYIKIVKVDAESGKTIPHAGAGFQLFRPNGSQITQTFTYPTPTTTDTFYTNDEGYLVTLEKLEYGTGYSMVEVQAPYGYVLNSDPVYFDVTQGASSEEGGVTVIEVTKPNLAQKGIIKISKTGEVFAPSPNRKEYSSRCTRCRGFPAQFTKSPPPRTSTRWTAHSAILPARWWIPSPPARMEPPRASRCTWGNLRSGRPKLLSAWC